MKSIVKLVRIQLYAVLSFALIMSTMPVVFAQSVDVSAPNISHSVAASGAAGDNLLIEAEVTDNVGVATVVLHYRFKGEIAFEEIPMSHEGGDQYAALVPTEDNVETELEYYIEAADAGGTKTTRGLSFDPLSVAISVQQSQEPEPVESETVESPLLAETTPTESEAPVVPKPKSKKLWYIVGGVLLLGIAAAGLGGDSGGEEPPASACSDAGCQVTFTADPM